MTKVLEIISLVLPIIAAALAILFGAAKVRRLREETGDKSQLTSILGGTWLAK